MNTGQGWLPPLEQVRRIAIAEHRRRLGDGPRHHRPVKSDVPTRGLEFRPRRLDGLAVLFGP
jgi:hypothetical protein